MSYEEELVALIRGYADQRARALLWKNGGGSWFRNVIGPVTTQVTAWIVPFLVLFGLGVDPLVAARVAALPYALILGVGWMVSLTLILLASSSVRTERDKILARVAGRPTTYDLAKLQKLLDAEDDLT